MTNQTHELKIAYIGGGSRGWAWRLMSDLALEPVLGGKIALYDLDDQAAHDNQIIGNNLSKRKDVPGKWEYQAIPTMEEALAGADFIIISILPGTFREMASDVHAPEKYGIYQSVGDTVGPGGLLRALRTIPIYVGFAEQIKKYAPKAWVINYTNPMTLCTRTLYEIFPEIKAFGCCHEVFGTQKLLAEALKAMEGFDGVARDEISVNVLGINHFTWIDKANYKGLDLFPLYTRFVERYYESGFENGHDGNWINDFFTSAQRVKFDLFKRYRLIAAAGDRHLAEFLPPWYLKDPETAHFWKFQLTPVSWRIAHQQELAAKSKRLVSGAEEVQLEQSGEEGIRQIKALLGLGDYITNVNLPNQGQMPDVPLGSVVETNAVFSGNGIRPVMAGKLPPAVQALVARQVFNQETILKAALNKDWEMALEAFVNDPLVTVNLSQARELFSQMLENTKEYLPGWDLKGND